MNTMMWMKVTRMLAVAAVTSTIGMKLQATANEAVPEPPAGNDIRKGFIIGNGFTVEGMCRHVDP